MTAILKIVKLPYFNEVQSNFDEILYAFGTITKLISPKPKILKSDMAGGCHFGQYIFGYNSTT